MGKFLGFFLLPYGIIIFVAALIEWCEMGLIYGLILAVPLVMLSMSHWVVYSVSVFQSGMYRKKLEKIAAVVIGTTLQMILYSVALSKFAMGC